MRIADDIEAIGRRYRELFRPSSEQPSPPKPEPETNSAAETMCPCGWPVSHCFFCVGTSPRSSNSKGELRDRRNPSCRWRPERRPMTPPGDEDGASNPVHR